MAVGEQWFRAWVVVFRTVWNLIGRLIGIDCTLYLSSSLLTH